MGKKPIMISSHDVNCDAEYTVWVEDLKRSYRMVQVNTVLKTNFEKLKWYWNMGDETMVLFLCR